MHRLFSLSCSTVAYFRNPRLPSPSTCLPLLEAAGALFHSITPISPARQEQPAKHRHPLPLRSRDTTCPLWRENQRPSRHQRAARPMQQQQQQQQSTGDSRRRGRRSNRDRRIRTVRTRRRRLVRVQRLVGVTPMVFGSKDSKADHAPNGLPIQKIAQASWCWYCDREFEDDRILLSHQKAKHFRCPHCPRRLNTAGGLAVHIDQVHKLPVDKCVPFIV
jgi:DNA-directed RNA polymerase subunit RPC12/RpoP